VPNGRLAQPKDDQSSCSGAPDPFTNVTWTGVVDRAEQPDRTGAG
jgi:hypothetical protein